MPAVGSKAASDEGADKPPAGASPAVPLSATHGADSGAADARSDAPPRETQMDAVINGTGSPIPINPDPLAISGGDKAADASAGAAAARGRSPEPGSVSASDASGAAPASKKGAAAADDAWAVAAAPARVPIPPIRPVVLRDKERSPLPTAPPVASSGGIY